MISHITDEQLLNMSLEQMNDMFNCAQKIGLLDEFVTEFWTRMSRLSSHTESKSKYCNNVMRRLDELEAIIVNQSKYLETLVTSYAKRLEKVIRKLDK